jgi:AraC-like DNA-binding protein
VKVAEVSRKHAPCDALAPWVAGFEVMESGGSAGPATILPDLDPVMGFQYRGRVISVADQGERLLDSFGITGIQSEARQYRYLPGSGTVLVRFHPWGAAAFLPAPMDELADRSVGLDEILSQSLTGPFKEELDAARDDAGRIRAVENFLLATLRNRTPDGLVRRAVRLLQSGNVGVTVEGLAGQLGLGDRQLERKFKEWVGIGPKRFARLVRFRETVRRMRLSPWAFGSSLEPGYYDQAHFIKDFRAFAGTTPEAFLRSLRAPKP